MLAKKFIVFNDKEGKLEMKLGEVEFHFELLPNGISKALGGGRYLVEDDIVYFYGFSTDFGKINELTFSYFRNFLSKKFPNKKIYFSTCDYISEAKREIDNEKTL